MHDLAEDIGETVNFVAPDDKGMSYKDRVETNWAFRIQLPIGSHVPFHCTASGKVFLATLPKREQRRLVTAMSLEERTPNTLSHPDRLSEELKQISKQGFALDDQEFIKGMVAAAVPVWDPSGRYFASLAFHGPDQRVSIEDAENLVPKLRTAADKITQAMF